MQRACNARGLSCTLVDLMADRAIAPYAPAASPSAASDRPAHASHATWAVARLAALHRSGRLPSIASQSGFRAFERQPSDVTLLLANDSARTVLSSPINPSGATRRIGAIARSPCESHALWSPVSTSAARGVRRDSGRHFGGDSPQGRPYRDWEVRRRFEIPTARRSRTRHLRVVFAPFAGARVAELSERTEKFGDEHRAFERRDRPRAAAVVARLYRGFTRIPSQRERLTVRTAAAETTRLRPHASRARTTRPTYRMAARSSRAR